MWVSPLEIWAAGHLLFILSGLRAIQWFLSLMTTRTTKQVENQCHKPPIWEWFIAPIKMVILGMVYYCFTNINNNHSVDEIYFPRSFDSSEVFSELTRTRTSLGPPLL